MIIEFKVSNEEAFLLEFGSQYIRFYKNYKRLVKNSGEVYEVITEYSQEDVNNLRYVQNGDVLYLFSPKHSVKTLSRYGDFDWRLEEFVFKGGPWDNVNTTDTTLKASETSGDITITSTGDVFSNSDIGRLVRLTITDDESVTWQAEKTYSVGQVVKSDGKYYECISGDKSGNEKPVHTEGTKTDGGIKWKYVHSGYGVARITGFKSSKEVNAKVLEVFPRGVVNNSTTHWELGLISGATGYPICGTFYRNRFCFMLDVRGIPYVCISCYDDYNNFSDMDFGENLSNNAITIPVYSDKYNESRWLAGSNVLFVGTSSAEFYIDSASSGEPFGPGNSKIQQISNIGSKAITPVKIGAHIIFVTATGTSIRDIIYSFSTDSYDPIDLGIYGKHLLAAGIVDMKYQEYPDKIIWFAMKDGRLIGMTFSSEQKVNALHQHNLGGDVKEIVVLPNNKGNSEDLWVVVNRGEDYIEYLDNGIPAVIPEGEDRDEYIKDNCVYLDSCVKVTLLPGEREVTGLEHLEGKEVSIFADGAEKNPQVVKGGKVVLEKEATNVLVGLKITSEYIPQTIIVPTQNGSGVGDVQRIDHVTLTLWNSLGGSVGNAHKEYPIGYRTTTDVMGKSAPLFTGNKTIPVSFNTTTIEEKGATILVSNSSAYPMHILCISPKINVSGN